ncbi:MAG: carbohydrate porin, partial [Phycisphaeraceae bacterium]|nr:carbohydrate porin [Phycisphaeraceae bacterium]
IIMVLVAGPAGAQDVPWLAGDWNGQRQTLADTGIGFEFVLTLEGVQNVAGGVARSSRGLLNLDLIMDAEGQALGLSEQGALHVYFLGNDGGDPTEMIGDLQTTSNIETTNTLKLYELWWQQRFADNHMAWLLGMHDYNATFNALDTASLFTNSSFGISPDISQVSPSIFSTTSLAFMLSLYGDQDTYLHAAAYDGVPGDPGDDQGTQIVLQNDDGVFYALEGGFHDEDAGTKLALGVWHRTTDFDADFSGVSYSDNSGVYVIGETPLNEKWASFCQLGHANKNRNQVGNYVGTGLTYSNWLMPEDTVGVGLAYANASSAHRDANPGMDDYEMAIECTYEFSPTPWLTLQPDIQFIQNPGMDAALDDAVALSLRAYIAF